MHFLTLNIKNKFIKLINNRTIQNGAWMYLLQAFNTIVPFLTIPYITRILGKSRYGIFSTALNNSGYLQVLIEYGFSMSATREVAKSSNNQIELNSIFSNVIYSRLLLYLFSAFLCTIYMFVERDDHLLCLCILSLLLCLFGFVVQQNWFFLGIQETKYISIVNIIGRCVSAILVFLLVKTKEDIIKYAILYSISPLLSGFIGLFICIKKYKLHFIPPSVADIIKTLKSGFFVFTTQLSSKIFGAIGITFLGLFGTNEDVGGFSAIQKIPTLLLMLWVPIGQVMYPISSTKLLEDEQIGVHFIKKAQKIFIIAFGILITIICLFSKTLVNCVFGEEYVEYSILVIPLSCYVLVSIYNNFLGQQLLLAKGYDKDYSKVFQIGLLVTVLCNYLCIYRFSAFGASIAPLISDIILCGMLFYKVKKLFGDY